MESLDNRSYEKVEIQNPLPLPPKPQQKQPSDRPTPSPLLQFHSTRSARNGNDYSRQHGRSVAAPQLQVVSYLRNLDQPKQQPKYFESEPIYECPH